MNRRLERLFEAIETDFREIQQVIADLETREQNPAFQTAKRLFAEGWRLENWGAVLTDTDKEIYLRRDGREIGYWADGVSRSTERAFALIGIEKTSQNDEALYFLSDLTEEE